MTDSELIWKFLTREYSDDHPVIYLYSCGNVRSPKIAIEKVLSLTKNIFVPGIKESTLSTIIKSFLDFKKKQYSLGLISIKRLY